MTVDLKRDFDELERLRFELSNATLALDDAQRDWKPSPDVWSIQEIVEHLVLSDETVGHPTATVASEPWPLRILPRSLRRAAILTAFRRNVALPLPSPLLQPRGQAPLTELLDRWLASREAIRQDLDSPDIADLHYGHPVLGPLTAAQMLRLGIEHTAYHQRQAQTLWRRLDFDANG